MHLVGINSSESMKMQGHTNPKFKNYHNIFSERTVENRDKHRSG